MKLEFFPKLAMDGIRKNKRLYTPYILACIGMVAMLYIITFLSQSPLVYSARGGYTACMAMEFGSWVIAVFSCIFLFYTNAFLIRRRKKEFGLYNILGMEKRHIGVILFWETLITALIALAAGLALGVLLSKLVELALLKLLQSGVTFAFSVSVPALARTAVVFAVIFALLFLNALRQVRFSSAIALLRSESAGEKPPRANWLLGVLGVALLGAAYYVAVTVADPVSALFWFFIAVLLVIFATFLLLISGSVVLCRALQKNRRYYYRADHFVSVSSMTYRMKRNGAGLASICILATMVLVMLSSTASLYFGADDALKTRYPREEDITLWLREPRQLTDDTVPQVRAALDKMLQETGVTPQDALDYRCARVYGNLRGEDAQLVAGYGTSGSLCGFEWIPLSDYNAATGENRVLGNGEVLLCAHHTTYRSDTIRFETVCTFRIAEHIAPADFPFSPSSMESVPTLMLVVDDPQAALAPLYALQDDSGKPLLSTRWVYQFDTGLSEDAQIALLDGDGGLHDTLFENSNDGKAYGYDAQSRASNKDDFFATFGSLFFLGALLSVVFTFAAVLIIYYKQVSEGYEDQARFAIMQSIGMTRREIRRSIDSQLLTVFFLPLGLAGVHLVFAFPMVRKVLTLFGLQNATLFASVTALSFVFFAVIYAIIYRATSSAYFAIVSDAERE